MHPILVRLGPLTIYSYGMVLVLAFLTATWVAGHVARRLPSALVAITSEQIVDFTCLALIGGIVGARALYVVLQWDVFRRTPAEIPAIWHGGLVWYGGFFGGLLAGWLYVRAKRLVFLRVMDQFVPFLALGHAIGRIGCFFNGCCYGKPTTGWCGVLFPGHTERVIPTQLLESAGLLVLYVLLRRLQRPRQLQQSGFVFGSYLIGYGILRFLLEFLRGDQSLWLAQLTLQQLISLGLSVLGLTMVGTAFRRRDGAHV